MINYITAQEASKKWNLTSRRVQVLCNQNRIVGAYKKSGIWLVPATATKPAKLNKICHDEQRLPSIYTLSLFSGCGGMDLGFEGDFDVLAAAVNLKINPSWKIKPTYDKHWVHVSKTRFHTIFANDIREDAKYAWIRYFSSKGICDSTYCLDSIVDLVKLQKENGINIFPQNVDIVTGGFPCQDFSVAGKRLGFGSDKNHIGTKLDEKTSNIESRGQLYKWMREVVALTQPKIFVAENVKGLVNLADAKKIIEKDFSTINHNGYIVVDAKVLHAADYGIPQSRERVIFFGFKKSALNSKALSALTSSVIPREYDPYPVPTHNFTQTHVNGLPPTTLQQAFYGLIEPELSSDLSQKKYSKAKYMGKHCQGQSEIDLNGLGPTIRSEHHGNIEFRRLNEEHNGKYLDELKAGFKERRLSVRECARIQTFPDDYEFVFNGEKNFKGVTASNAYKIIGNAVPPLLAYNIAKRLEENWELYFGMEKNDNIK